MRITRGFTLALAIALGASADSSLGAYRPVPDDGVIRITDYGFRDWGPEVVHYAIDVARFSPGRLVLLDGDGRAVPMQIERGALTFIARVAKGQTATYTPQRADNDRSAEQSTLTRASGPDSVEVGNEFFTLRLPKPQKRQFTPGAAAQDVTPPILGWKQAGFDWQGGAHFVTTRNVSSIEVRAIDDGPATVAYEARYRFEPQGE